MRNIEFKPVINEDEYSLHTLNNTKNKFGGKCSSKCKFILNLKPCVQYCELQCMWIYETGYFGEEEVSLIMMKA